MKLDGPGLRARRLQLGQTTRGLAREAHVSQTLIKRLEETGEVASITCATLQSILDGLSLDLVEILDKHEPRRSSNERDLERVGAILVEQRRGTTSADLALQLSIGGRPWRRSSRSLRRACGPLASAFIVDPQASVSHQSMRPAT